MEKPKKKKLVHLDGVKDENPSDLIIDTLSGDYGSSLLGSLGLGTGSKNGLSYLFNKYLDRSKENNPSYVRTDMNGTQTIEFDLNSNEEQVIFTFGLGGCFASALVIEFADGKTESIMTHYDPLSLKLGEVDIARYLSSLNKDEVVQSKLFVVAPGEWSKNDEGKWVMKTKNRYESPIHWYSEAVNSILGVKVDYVELPYSEQRNLDSEDQGTFRIIKNSQGEVRYIMENYYPQGLVFEN